MSRPSKRFVLPYEPEYTTHRTDRHLERIMQLHRLGRQRLMSPSLVPHASAGEGGPGDSATGHDRALEPQGFRYRN
jgi:hypothetical protein